MQNVKAKKHLGQHFLKDESIAAQIADSVLMQGYNQVLEVGPGMGVLTKYLLQKEGIVLTAAEIDTESVEYLMQHADKFLGLKVIQGDVLKMPLSVISTEGLAIVGNFPYNISSQILFMAYENRGQVKEVTGMFQKEVAKRIASPPGSREYGILSVFLQAFYTIEYLFTVDEWVFQPPPKVKSGVIRLVRNNVETLPCDEKAFYRLVKMAFNQRRKMLGNAIRPLLTSPLPDWPELTKRAEQLSVEQFVSLTNKIEALRSKSVAQ